MSLPTPYIGSLTKLWQTCPVVAVWLQTHECLQLQTAFFHGGGSRPQGVIVFFRLLPGHIFTVLTGKASHIYALARTYPPPSVFSNYSLRATQLIKHIFRPKATPLWAQNSVSFTCQLCQASSGCSHHVVEECHLKAKRTELQSQQMLSSASWGVGLMRRSEAASGFWLRLARCQISLPPGVKDTRRMIFSNLKKCCPLSTTKLTLESSCMTNFSFNHSWIAIH